MAESDAILQLGIEAAREGNREEARNLFSLLTRQEPSNVQGWLWLAGVADGPDERRAALERVVQLDPTNEMAIRGLQAMGVNPSDIARTTPSTPTVATEAPVITPVPTAADRRNDLYEEYDARAAAEREEARREEARREEARQDEARTVEPAPVASPYEEEDDFYSDLDSAYTEYDQVEKVAGPARDRELTEEEIRDRERMAAAASSRGFAARQAAAANRTERTEQDDMYDDYDDRPARRGPSPLLLGIVGLILLILLGFLVWNFLSGRGDNVVQGGATAVTGAANGAGTAVAGGANAIGTVTTPDGTPILDSGAGVITGTDTVSGTVPADGSTPPADGTTPPADGQAGGNVDDATLAQSAPAPQAIGTQLSANNWTYTFPGVCGVSCAAVLGNQVGGQTAQGQYVVVLTFVGNNTGTDQPLPADFFVLKDDQGRVYAPVAEVSNAYAQPGVNADIALSSPVVANGAYTSIPLVFDVPSGATNLTFFARSNTAQGFQVLNAVP